jgi:hypothetical protein
MFAPISVKDANLVNVQINILEDILIDFFHYCLGLIGSTSYVHPEGKTKAEH